MMKKLLLMVAMAVVLFACENDELSDLDKRVDELEQRLEESGLDDMVEDLDALKQKVDELDLELDDVIDSLNSIADQIEEIKKELEDDDKDDIYWGDVLSDEQFATVASEGYTKITGQVQVRTANHVSQLSEVEYIGGNLSISDVTTSTFSELEVVSGNIYVSNITSGVGVVSFPELNSIGGSFDTDAETMYALQSIEMPKLTVVGGDFKVSLLDDYENLNIFSTLNTSLSVVGGDFGIYNAKQLVDLQTPLTYIGGDYTLLNNSILKISASNFSTIGEIGGSIVFTDNYSSGGASTTSDFGSMVAFENLTALGGGITFTGSEDVTEFGGFSSLTTLKGDLTISMSLNTLDNVFNELLIAKGDIYLWLPSYNETPSIIDGFELLHTVEGGFSVEASEIYGFEKLETACYSFDNVFQVTATRMPSFESLVSLKQGTSMMLVLTGENYNNIMPLFTMDAGGWINNISLEFTFYTDGAVSFEGLNALTQLSNLTVYHDSSTELDFNALNSLNSVGWYQNESDFVNLLCTSTEMDYSSLETYFLAKGMDYLDNQNSYNEQYEQYVIDSTIYVTYPDSIDEPYAPYYYENMSESIALYQNSYWDNDANEYMPYINYAEEKMDETSDIPALIQAFIHFGKMEASDFGL